MGICLITSEGVQDAFSGRRLNPEDEAVILSNMPQKPEQKEEAKEKSDRES